MLRETYRLVQKLKEEIPFENITSIFLFEESLIIQTFFRKQKKPYFYNQPFSKKIMETTILSETLINSFINNLKEFYLNINPEELEKCELLNQTTITNKKEETNDRTN